jgi:GTPase-associated protein 1, N-terminal domain type 2/GTPase-associated protein 1, middle domain
VAAQRIRRDWPEPGVSGGFGSLYYTDCRPGQGLQGGAGFQFQAASPGVSPEAMPLVQRTALYEPPVRWMRERRPVADYPPSLAHTAEAGVFVTAAGRYLGQEANGTREGNQFTHAIVTRDPADYGVMRPAQLWGASWWAEEPAPSTELDELVNPEPGLDFETVRDRVRDTAGGQAQLTALLSAIHHLADPTHRRTVVLISTDPEKAACWIAAATLLLPGHEALHVSFKIFVADGQYGQHDIIALHPEWSGRWADTAGGNGLAVFDLDHGHHTDVEATTAACFWVPRWLTEDPYDVVDAVEHAGQFARARGSTADADRLIAVVVAFGERLTGSDQVQQATDWLLTAPEEAMKIARDAVLAAVLDAGPGVAELRKLAAHADSRGWAPAVAEIRRRLLTAEIGEVLAASDGVAALRTFTALAPLPPMDRLGQDLGQQQGRAEVEAALRGARPVQVPALLTVAERHAVQPVTANFRSSAYEFAAWWVPHPYPDLEPGRWPAPPEALDWVRDVLRGWLAGPHHDHAVAAVHERWWRPLWQQACDPTDPLDAELIALACQHLTGPPRNQLIRDTQDWTFARMVGQAHPSTVAWNTVFGTRRPGMSEATVFLTGLVDSGRTLSPEVGSQLCVVLEAQPILSEEALWTVSQLCKHGHPLPSRLAGLHISDDAIHRVDDKFEVNAPIVLDGLLAAPRDVALALGLSCSDEVAHPVHEELKARWPAHAGTATAGECRAVAFTFVLANGKPRTEQQRAALRGLLHCLAALVAAMPQDVRTAVEHSYPGGLGQPWWDWVSEVQPRRWSLRRRPSAASAKKPGKRGE